MLIRPDWLQHTIHNVKEKKQLIQHKIQAYTK